MSMSTYLTYAPFLEAFSGDAMNRNGMDPHAFLLSVQRNLNTLLNSRNRIYEIPLSHSHARESILDFGILDFSSLNMTAEVGQQRLADAIQAAIQRYEPRLQQVSVSVLPESKDTELTLRFRIDATLNFKPHHERIRWDSVMEPVSRQITLTEASHE